VLRAWPFRSVGSLTVKEELTAREDFLSGHQGDELLAYVARPTGAGPFGNVVVIHHMPGWDSATKEITRRFAAHGYLAICPNLHYREAPGASPDDASAAVRAAGGVPDDRLAGDVAGAAAYLRAQPGSNGKVGVIGYCSGGRQAFLAACRLPLQAAVDCYGGAVVGDPPAGMHHIGPVIGLAKDLTCPLLGLFGAEDKSPSPDHTAQLAAELTRYGKDFDFHTYEGAGHAFFAVDRPAYRQHAAVEGWQRIWEFFGRHVAG
jgi:carboxymethylenebutenolidase